jgi:hypothetical protein
MNPWTQEEWSSRLVTKMSKRTFASFSEMGTVLEDLELIEGLEDKEPILWKTLTDERSSAFMAAGGYVGAARVRNTGEVLLVKQPVPGALIEVETATINPQLSLIEQAELTGNVSGSSGWVGSNLALAVVGVGAVGALLWIMFQGKSKGTR